MSSPGWSRPRGWGQLLGLADWLGAVALTAGLVGLALKMRAREGLPKADEGYLWYGTLRVLAGEVPVRDFRSYEPGRYLWCALAARSGREGLVALRVSVHSFFAVGMVCGLLALRLGGVGWTAVAGAAMLLALWAFPGHKLFEPALLLIAVLAGTQLMSAPGLASEFVLGAAVSVIGLFGVNLALYTGVAALALTLLVSITAPGESVGDLAAFAAGILVGALPLLGWFAVARGTAAVFWERRVLTVLRRGTTNLRLPVPWPWRLRDKPDPLLGEAGNLSLGLLFTMLPLLGAGVWIWAALASWSALHAHPAVVAAAAVGLPSLHHAVSRADLSHLAPVVAPFIVLLAALFPGGPWAVLPLALLGPAAMVTVIMVHPRRSRLQVPYAYETMSVGSDRIRVPSVEARRLEALRELIDHRLRPGEPVVLVPTLPGLLPLFDRRSGVYDTFCVYPARLPEQERMLRSIQDEKIRLVVVQDLALDDREDLRFVHTHPLVWQALESGFARLAVSGVSPDLCVYWRETPGPLATSPGARSGSPGAAVEPGIAALP